MTEMSNIYEGMTRIVVETPEHLEIQKLTEQIRERVDKLEWMLSQFKVTVEKRDELEAAWTNLKNAKAAPTNTSESDLSHPTPSPLTPNS